LKHFFYSAGWKKFERAWDLMIRIKQLSQMRPLLEAVLAPVAQPKINSNNPQAAPALSRPLTVGSHMVQILDRVENHGV
jgi:hypothetical protein